MAIDTGSAPTTAPEPPSGAPPQDLVMRLWRGDASGGRFQEVPRRSSRGRGRARRRAPHPGDPGARPRGPVELQSGEVRLLQRRDQRPARLDVHDADEHAGDRPAVTVSPMRAFPIMRDLVTTSPTTSEVAKLIPAFKPGPRDPDGLYRMAQVDIDRGQEFHKCIECFLCQNVCHVIRDHEENKPRYAGPRFFVRLAELEMHPLDTLDRRDYIHQDMGIGYCNITKCCTEVCPRTSTSPTTRSSFERAHRRLALRPGRVAGSQDHRTSGSAAGLGGRNTRVRRTHSLPRRLRQTR